MGRTIFACGLFLFLMSCIRIPVEAYNPRDDKGQIQPLATVPEPTITFPMGSATAPDGTVAPVYRTEAAADARPPAPAPEPFPWSLVLNIALGTLGLTGMAGGGWGMIVAGIAKRALKATAEYADKVEEAANPLTVPNSDAELKVRMEAAERIRQAKRDAAAKQRAQGVHQVIQKARGKL